MKAKRFISIILVVMLALGVVINEAQGQQPASASSKTNYSTDAVKRINSSTLLARVWRGRRAGFGLMPSSSYASVDSVSAAMSVSPPAVLGNGTVGHISMWTGTSPSGNAILGDSIITQSNDNIGIGLATPMSKLSVQGMIETTLGGYKFPDGTIQTTAAVSGLQMVSHDLTLTGDGTSGSPLGIALPLNLVGAAPAPPAHTFPLLTVRNTAESGLGIMGIGAPGPFGGDGVFGQGGESTDAGRGGAGVHAFGAHYRGFGGPGVGVQALGGSNLTSDGHPGGSGLEAVGGFNPTGTGGDGVLARGGTSQSGMGGVAIRAFGAEASTGPADAGQGIVAVGGKAIDGVGGSGVQAVGGKVRSSGLAGVGVVATGGEHTGTNADRKGGNGVEANGGTSNGGFGGNGVVATGGDFNGRGVVATGGVGSVGYGVEATGGASTGSGSTAGAGVLAKGGPSSGPNSESGFGIIAVAGDATNGAMRGRAGEFQGDVFITNNLTIAGNLDVQGTKHFKIDHPLDPENKYLLHASVESSEVLNVYSGNVVTNAKGEAVVTLSDWFEALNRDLRYQLTVIGTFAQAIVANEVQNNRFTIKTSAPNVKVSWQVTGVRSDKAVKKQPFKAEADKPEQERGHYLQPELYDQPEERGVEWARHPELMKQLKQQRLEAQQAEKQRKQIGRLIP